MGGNCTVAGWLAVQRVVVISGDSLPAFWDNLSVPSSRLKDLLRLLTHEIGTTVFVLTLRLLMSYIYIYGAPILDVSRSHTTTHHSR